MQTEELLIIYYNDFKLLNERLRVLRNHWLFYQNFCKQLWAKICCFVLQVVFYSPITKDSTVLFSWV